MAESVSNSVYIPDYYKYSNKKEFSTELGQDAFLKLLIEQLKHQDPLSPMDNQQFIQQTTMMTMVERLTRMQTLMEEANSSLLNLREYEGLIGKTATYEVVSKDELTGKETREQRTGEISGVKMVDGKIYFTIGNDLVAREKINGLESKGMTNDSLLDNTLKFAQLLGKTVDYVEQTVEDVDGDPTTTDDQTTVEVRKTGVIASFSVNDGKVEFVLADGKKITLADIRGLELKPDNLPIDHTLKYTQLIGYQVTYLDETTNEDGSTEQQEKTGIITAVSMKNGLVEFLLEGDKKLKLNEIIGFKAPGS